jgi:hypothetical protein
LRDHMAHQPLDLPRSPTPPKQGLVDGNISAPPSAAPLKHQTTHMLITTTSSASSPDAYALRFDPHLQNHANDSRKTALLTEDPSRFPFLAGRCSAEIMIPRVLQSPPLCDPDPVPPSPRLRLSSHTIFPLFCTTQPPSTAHSAGGMLG